MNDPENFLSRWSRRKRTATEEERAGSPPSEAVAEDHPREEAQANSADVESAEKKEGAEPAFDLSKLPSIESITAETDIRAFLAPGVPAELTRAALRRAWVIDPKIRDFIEVAENQWDFTAPGVPGFDLSPPTGDIKQMLAQILPKALRDESDSEGSGDKPEHASPRIDSVPHRNVTEPAQSSDEPEKPEQERLSQHAPAASAANPGIDDAALQKNSALQDERPVLRRGHGGAMPR